MSLAKTNAERYAAMAKDLIDAARKVSAASRLAKNDMDELARAFAVLTHAGRPGVVPRFAVRRPTLCHGCFRRYTPSWYLIYIGEKSAGYCEPCLILARGSKLKRLYFNLLTESNVKSIKE